MASQSGDEYRYPKGHRGGGDDADLWDELSHQQSREVQQYRSLSPPSSSPKTYSFRRAMQQTSTAITSAAAAAKEGVAGSVLGSHYRPLHESEASSGIRAALAEFGFHSAASFGGGQRRPPTSASEDHGAIDSPLLENNDAQQGNKNNFVLLDRFRLTPKRDGWGAVPDLDLFFTSIYNYYYHRGLVPLLGKGIVELVSLFFTLWLSVFLLAYLDWAAIFTCKDEATCRPQLQEYIIEQPFSKVSFWNFIVILYCLLFSAYGVFSIASFIASARDAFQAKFFFEDKLGISSRKLEGGAVEWSEIVDKIVDLQRTGEYRVAIHGQEINALIVAQTILRRENFMVAFFNRNMLDMSIPLPWPFGVGGRSKTMFFSKSLEWSIYFCILSYMFNYKHQIRPAFYLDPVSLQRRFFVCGIAHAVFMPFLLIFITLHFVMQNTYDFRSSKQYLGPREWSNVAKWSFREFNELPHLFEQRIGPSYKASEDYLKLFVQSAVMHSIGRALVFISGSLGAVLIAFAAINDSIVLHVKLGPWNLLWYIGILGAGYSVGKGLLPDSDIHPPYTRNLFAEMDFALAKVSSYTHYYPDYWRNRGWDDLIKKSFTQLFQYKAHLFLLEVQSVIVAPLVLCLSLPQCASSICSFVQNVKIDVPGVGDVCGFSTFDFDTFEDEHWEGRTLGTNVRREGGDVDWQANAAASYGNRSWRDSVTKIIARPKACQGKMEKSFFNFKTVYPKWKCNTSGQYLVDRIESYQQCQAVALARERNYHIAAAVRQLATLCQMEQQGETDTFSTRVGLNNVDETYISQKPTTSGADNSGGIVANGNAATPDDRKSNTQLQSHHQNPHFQSQDLADSEFTFGSLLSSQSGATHHAGSASRIAPFSTPHIGMASPSLAGYTNTSNTTSAINYTDKALSSELQPTLDRFTPESGASLKGSALDIVLDRSLSSQSQLRSAAILEPKPSDLQPCEDDIQRQYLWLERYHSHVTSDQLSLQQERQQCTTRPKHKQQQTQTPPKIHYARAADPASNLSGTCVTGSSGVKNTITVDELA